MVGSDAYALKIKCLKGGMGRTVRAEEEKEEEEEKQIHFTGDGLLWKETTVSQQEAEDVVGCF